MQIKTIELTNVMGVVQEKHDFIKEPIITNYNGTGKSTILNTISWLLTGSKDLSNSDFKPQNLTNADSYKAEMVIDMNGVEKTLKIDGKNYFIDDVKYIKSKYISALGELFGHFELAKYINGRFVTESQWKIARDIVVGEISTVSQEDVEKELVNRNFNPELIKKSKDIRWEIQTARNNMNEWKTKVAVATQATKQEMESKSSDVSAISELLTTKESELVDKKAQIDKLSDDKKVALKDQSAIENALKKPTQEVTTLKSLIAQYTVDIESLTKGLEDESEQYATGKCGSCNQALPKEIMDTYLVERKEILEYAPGKIKELKENKEVAEKALVEFESKVSQITTLKTNVESGMAVNENLLGSLSRETGILAGEIARLKDAINKSSTDQVDKYKAKQQYAEEQFNAWDEIINIITSKAMIEAEMNQLILKEIFPTFDLKLSKTTQTGVVKETFEIWRNGVEYSKLNTASKIVIGVEICKYLQKAKGLNLPIIIDDMEGLDNANMNMVVEGDYQIIGAFVRHELIKYGKKDNKKDKDKDGQ